jgi:bifunctional non-homologous end joining protein LigD
MSALLPELAQVLPADVQLEGELVAYRPDGRSDFDRLGAGMLHGEQAIPITYVVVDVLAAEGLANTALPYSERRALLETERADVQLVAAFEDGPALFDAVVELELESVVAKRKGDPYRPGERAWVKLLLRRERAMSCLGYSLSSNRVSVLARRGCRCA